MGIDPEKALFETLDKLPKVSRVDARVVLQAMYETNFGIYNHFHVLNKKERPIAAVAMFAAEEVNKHSLFEDAARQYVDMNIRGLFGLNFFEYLNMPRDRIELLHTVARDENRRKASNVNSVAQQLEAELKRQE